MVRIMDPTNDYPNGYVVYYGSDGNPLDRFGVGGKPRADWHHELGQGEPMPGYIEWLNEMIDK
jgi:hypothetical protein